MSKSNRPRTALVLSGGGARGAYQVGVLKAVAEVTGYKESPFDIVSGLSAGAINGTWIASHDESFPDVVESMWQAWAGISSDDIFKTNPFSLFSIGARWLIDRTFGGMNRKHQITYLLDTAPLAKFLHEKIDFENLNHRLQAGKLYGVSVTAANYHTGMSTTFFGGDPEIPEWKKENRIGRRGEIHGRHVMASAAIPIFFPPVLIEENFFGDGVVRSSAPLSSAIHMGAQKLFLIGTRGSISSPPPPMEKDFISIGEIAGTVLNGLFFDALDADYDRMLRVNRTLSTMTPEQLARQPDGLKTIPVFYVRPSRASRDDLGDCEINQAPSTLRYLFKGIGMDRHKGTDMLSYLLFEKKHIASLLELGYQDGLAQKEQILAFFS